MSACFIWPRGPARRRSRRSSPICWGSTKRRPLTSSAIRYGCRNRRHYRHSPQRCSTSGSTTSCWWGRWPVANRHGELLAMLRTLKLPAMAAAFPDLALKAAKGGQTHEAFLYDLVQCECVQRDERRITRLLHRSGLPQEKTFATLALDRFPLAVRQQIERLQGGAFVEEAINVIA